MSKCRKVETDHTDYMIIARCDGCDACEPYMGADLHGINVDFAEHFRQRDIRNECIRIQRRDDLIGWIGATIMAIGWPIVIALWIYGII